MKDFERPRVAHISLPQYAFNGAANPFAYDAEPRSSLDEIAKEIAWAVEALSGDGAVLVRGVQSGLHGTARSKAELIDGIIRHGSDVYEGAASERGTMFAAPFEGIETVQTILAGFHTFKPKCEDRPQHPVDIWMVFDADAYDNIEYVHPRHGVVAKDKWSRKTIDAAGLRGVVIVKGRRGA